MLEEFYIYSQEDLIEALSLKPDKIIIIGEYATQILGIMKNQLSENETLGVELGSHGILTILIYAIEHIRTYLSKKIKKLYILIEI